MLLVGCCILLGLSYCQAKMMLTAETFENSAVVRAITRSCLHSGACWDM